MPGKQGSKTNSFKKAVAAKAKKVNATTMDDAVSQASNELTREEGNFFIRYWRPMVLATALLVVLVIAQGITKHLREKEMKTNASLIFKFIDGPLKEMKDLETEAEKLDALAGLEGSFEDLMKKIDDDPGIIRAMNELFPLFTDLGKHVQLQKILDQLRVSLRTSPEALHFVMIAQVTNLENQGLYDKAIAILKDMAGMKLKLYEAKVHFDMARLYLIKEEKEQAKTKFQYVIDQFPEDTLANLSRAYLRTYQF